MALQAIAYLLVILVSSGSIAITLYNRSVIDTIITDNQGNLGVYLNTSLPVDSLWIPFENTDSGLVAYRISLLQALLETFSVMSVNVTAFDQELPPPERGDLRRRQAMAILVASPDLIRVFCRTPRQMVLANALCQALERTA